MLGLGIALLLHKPGFGLLRAIARVSLVIPLATTYAVVGLLGRLIFNREFGVANQFAGWPTRTGPLGRIRPMLLAAPCPAPAPRWTNRPHRSNA